MHTGLYPKPRHIPSTISPIHYLSMSIYSFLYPENVQAKKENHR